MIKKNKVIPVVFHKFKAHLSAACNLHIYISDTKQFFYNYPVCLNIIDNKNFCIRCTYMCILMFFPVLQLQNIFTVLLVHYPLQYLDFKNGTFSKFTPHTYLSTHKPYEFSCNGKTKSIPLYRMISLFFRSLKR